MPTYAFTISKLAEAAGVNIETVRYYQRRGILAEPPRADGGFRSYDASHVERLRVIRRAQELGFSLDDAAELVSLSRITSRKRVREIARSRAAEIHDRIADLRSLAGALEQLVDRCERTSPDHACPIIAALKDSLSGDDSVQGRKPAGTTDGLPHGSVAGIALPGSRPKRVSRA